MPTFSKNTLKKKNSLQKKKKRQYKKRNRKNKKSLKKKHRGGADIAMGLLLLGTAISAQKNM